MTPVERERLLYVLYYEFEMFSAVLCERPRTETERNARLECFLLHARNLIEFFNKPKNPKHKDDDLRCEDFLGEAAAEIKVTPPDNWNDLINKSLSHITRRPTPIVEWNPEDIRQRVNSAVRQFLGDLDDTYFSGTEKKANFYSLMSRKFAPHWARDSGVTASTSTTTNVVTTHTTSSEYGHVRSPSQLRIPPPKSEQ